MSGSDTVSVAADAAAPTGAVVSAQTSRFANVVGELSADAKALLAEVSVKAAELETLIQTLGSNRYVSLALTALEEAVAWAEKQAKTL